MNSKLFKLVPVLLTIFAMVNSASAQTGEGGGNKSFITGALAVGIAAGLAALGDGKAVAAACESTARNPSAGGRIFTMMILGLALIETLVLFTFLLAFLGK